jgi:SAM-dependent methyltransferase
VVGVDLVKHPEVGGRVDQFFEADLDGGIPAEAGGDFDVVVLADVLEHTVTPARVLAEVRGRLAPGGTVLVSIPNFAHWYPRLRVAAGRFDYDRRGILDRGHVRFFTDRSFRRLAADAGYRIRTRGVTGLPIEVAERGGAAGRSGLGGVGDVVGRVDRFAARQWPTMFGYQLLYELVPA